MVAEARAEAVTAWHTGTCKGVNHGTMFIIARVYSFAGPALAQRPPRRRAAPAATRASGVASIAAVIRSMGPSKKKGTPRTRTVTPTHARSGAAARLSRTTAAHARRCTPLRARLHAMPRAAEGPVGQPCFSTTWSASGLGLGLRVRVRVRVSLTLLLHDLRPQRGAVHHGQVLADGRA